MELSNLMSNKGYKLWKNMKFQLNISKNYAIGQKTQGHRHSGWILLWWKHHFKSINLIRQKEHITYLFICTGEEVTEYFWFSYDRMFTHSVYPHAELSHSLLYKFIFIATYYNTQKHYITLVDFLKHHIFQIIWPKCWEHYLVYFLRKI